MKTRQFHNRYAGIGWAGGTILIGLFCGCRAPESTGKKEGIVFENIAPKQALERMNAKDGYRYVDVRTVEEFTQGHAAGAVNVPVSNRDPATGKMVPNPEFLAVMERNFDRGQPLILGCRSGGRSSQAAKMLTESGFKHVYNLTGGYIGAFDASGQCTAPGWSMQGLPTSTDNSQGVSYDSLRKGR